MNLSQEKIESLLERQHSEVVESLVYRKLSEIEKDAANRKVFVELSAEEANHANVLKGYTGKTVQPNQWKVTKYYWLARIFGITFAIKLMEQHEENSIRFYSQFTDCPDLLQLGHDESVHETRLVEMINEERLEYMGSVVLGLNDALVEFTGALAGFTLALSNAPLIALTGSITGIAAALSMASSEYLSTKSENDGTKHPVKASIYTGIAYLVTVFVLVSPFIMFDNVLLALALMLAFALIIIALFNYYYSVARSESFRHRFSEMAILSFSVAGISFLIGYALKYFTGIEA